jgi:hypothetical protein
MRYQVAPAVVAGDHAELASAFRTIATWSVDDRWRSITDDGVASAERGDAAGVRAACGACHATFKATWRAQDRTRPPGPAR